MKELQPIKVFSKESGNAGNYRIPAIITTNKGTLIACCDERFFTGSDNPNRIDKVVRRSTDNGTTWGQQITAVQEMGESKNKSSASIDPCLVFDDKTNTIFMLYSHTPAGKGILNCKRGKGIDKDGNLIVLKGKEKFVLKDNYLYDSSNSKTEYFVDEQGNISLNNQYICNIFINDGEYNEYPTSYLYITTSNDDGLTWSKPVCIDNGIKEDYFTWIGAGPGVGIKVQNGKYKGRLILPIYYNVCNTPLMLSCAMIYSDDSGKTWTRGQSPNDNRKRWGIFPMSHKWVIPNEMLTETQLIECDNGKLKLFIRNHYSKRLVAIADSNDGGESWHNFRFHPQLDNCICQLSVINADYQGKTATIFLNPASKKARENGVVRVSFDYGETFPYSKTIKKDGFVYSSMCQMPNGDIGILYEGSTSHETIDFVTLSIDEIINNKE